MNADTIRDSYPPPSNTPYARESYTCKMLCEIAAQLADLNELLRKPDGHGLCVTLCASNDDIPVRVKT